MTTSRHSRLVALVAPAALALLSAGLPRAVLAGEAPVGADRQASQAVSTAMGAELRALSPRLLRWRFARIANVEVLTTAPEPETTRLFEKYALQLRALQTVWPDPSLREREPHVFVVTATRQEFRWMFPNDQRDVVGAVSYGRNGEVRVRMNIDPTTSQRPTNSQPAATLVPELGAGGGGSTRVIDNPGSPTETTRIRTGPEEPSMYEALESARVEQFVLRNFMGPALSRERAPSVRPAWLRTATVTLTEKMTATRTSATFPAVTSPLAAARKKGEETALRQALAAGTFLPLSTLLNAPSAPAGELFHAEAYEFLHLCLFGAGGKYKQAFGKLTAAVGSGARPTEEEFRQWFGVGYEQMELDLWRYTGAAKKFTAQLRTPEGKALPAPARVTYREATDEEIGFLVRSARGDAASR